MPAQLNFFASLDFPEDRTVLTVGEIAAKTRYTVQHILNHIEAGELTALDGSGKDAKRGSMRVPIESYRNFILRRLTNPKADDALPTLPEATRIALIGELWRGLPPAARGSVSRTLREALVA